MQVLKLVFAFILTFIGTSNPVEEIQYRPGIARSAPVEIGIDPSFTEEQKELIKSSFESWEKASSYNLNFKITWDQPRPATPNLSKAPESKEGIYLWNVSHTDPIMGPNWFDFIFFKGLTMYGVGPHSGRILIFKNLYLQDFHRTVLHEIGHLIGLSHNQHPMSTMYYTANSHCITQYDALELCQLYNCKPKPECLVVDMENPTFTFVPF